MTYVNGTTAFEEIIANTNILGIEWIITAMIVFLTLLLITRDPNKWKTLALPVTATWYLCGLETSGVFLIIAAIIFSIESFSIDMIGELLTAKEDPIKASIRKAAGGELLRRQKKSLKTKEEGEHIVPTGDIIKFLKKK